MRGCRAKKRELGIEFYKEDLLKEKRRISKRSRKLNRTVLCHKSQEEKEHFRKEGREHSVEQ